MPQAQYVAKSGLMNTLRAFHQNNSAKSPSPDHSHLALVMDGRRLISVKPATIPATIGSCKVEIKTDIIDSDIALLLSKAAMKKAKNSSTF